MTTGALEQASAQRARSVDQRVKAATEWFGLLAPSHETNPRAFVQLSLAQFSKVKNLREAADANPESMLSAMAECARLGLMPGDTGFYIPFRNKKAKGGWEVTFITHWTGEVDLILRTGVIDAVVVQVVRAADVFVWEPHSMRVPFHEIPENAQGQKGLADPKDRGRITGVYCYCVYKTGGTTFPTVMTVSEVGKHRDISKAGEDFWGPWNPASGKTDVKDEGPWTPDMVAKTAVKKHRGSAPRSPEFRAAMVRSVSVQAQAPAGADPASNREDIEAPQMAALTDGNGDERPQGTLEGRAESSRQERPLTKKENLARVGNMFSAVGLGGSEWAQVRLGLAAMMAAEDGASPVQVNAPDAFRAGEAARCRENFEQFLGNYDGDPGGAKLALLRAAKTAGLWDGEHPAWVEYTDPEPAPPSAEDMP